MKSEVYQKALDALKSGKSEEEMHQDVYGTSMEAETSAAEEEMDGTDESEDVLSMFNSPGEPASTEAESEQQLDNTATSIIDEEVGTQEAPTKEQSADSNVEFIKADGKQIKIDYNDHKRIKRAFAAEVGMRKFQRERDDLRKWKEENTEKLTNYDKLDELFQTEGVEGVVQQLAGRSLDEIVQERIDRIILSEENPLKASQLEYEDKLDRERRSRERLERQMQSMTEKTQAERDAADSARLESMIQPVFAQYSFAGKLGDADAEHAMDEALWNQAFARLEGLPDESTLTPAVIRREFRAVANTFGKIINKQVDRQTQQATASKRVAAKESLQRAVAAGTSESTANSEFIQKYKSGNMTGALVDILKGKVKL